MRAMYRGQGSFSNRDWMNLEQTDFWSIKLISCEDKIKPEFEYGTLYWHAPRLANLSTNSFQYRPEWEGTQQKSTHMPLEMTCISWDDRHLKLLIII